MLNTILINIILIQSSDRYASRIVFGTAYIKEGFNLMNLNLSNMTKDF